MEAKMDKIKTTLIIIISAIMDFLGILAIPVFLMVACNIIDYITGLMASKYREEQISSYIGIRGITKKVCMWLLVLVGSFIDIIINYTAEYMGIGFKIPFIVATFVAVWIVVNEMLSILENIIDIGVVLPPFLMPIVRLIRKEVESVAGESGQTN
ncbi:phage holin family protein [Lachnospiraceae bacterium MD335]|nr:phage holin family protein [Lachnospiraceae bacterium MD335]